MKLSLLLSALIFMLTLISASSIAATTEPNPLASGPNLQAEQWQLVATHKFSLIQSLLRGQGLAADEQGHFWYSGTASVLRAKSKTGKAAVTKIFPIPAELTKLGCDHIGDIDYYNGEIYAPVEDGSKHYKNPYIVIYDANKLTVKRSVRLPVEAQIEGVPWVAIDAGRGHAYSAPTYYNVTSLSVYDLKTLAHVGSLQFSMPINNWQGAKMLNGNMYATSDASVDGAKNVYKIDLDTGAVTKVATLPGDVGELEGLAFSKDANGVVEMNVLGIVRHGKNKFERTLSTRSQLFTYHQVQ